MTSGIAFILHSASDASYAAELAAAMPSVYAFPVEVSADAGARPTQYGLGAACIVVWTREMSAVSHGLFSAMPQSLANVLVARIGDTRLPEALLSDTIAKAHVVGNAAADAAAVIEALGRMSARLDSRLRPGNGTPGLAHTGATAGAARKNVFAVRSAWGMAATIAVVGAAAPVISARAGSGDIDVAENNAAAMRNSVASVAANSAAVAINEVGAVVETQAPAAPVAVFQRTAVVVTPDTPLSSDPALETLATMLQPSHADALGEIAPLPVFVEASAVLDPKAAGVIAAMVAGADVSEWKIEVASADVTEASKPGALEQSTKSNPGA